MRLVFLEERLQVEALDDPDADTTLVALTAEALEAADVRGLTCTPISRYANPRALAGDERRVAQESLELMKDLETFIGARHPASPARFLTQQAYHLQTSIVEVAMRAYVMREAIRAIRPNRVAALEETSEIWFWPDMQAPWITALDGMRASEHFELERLRAPRPSAGAPGTGARLRRVVRGARSRAGTLARRLVGGIRTVPQPPADALRILFVPYPRYDWAPVARHLRGRAACFVMEFAPLEGAPGWTVALRGKVSDLRSPASHELGAEFAPDADEAAIIASLVDEWIRQTPSRRLDVLGIDVLPSLVPHLRSVAAVSAGVARHADEISERALDAVRPQAVCLFAIPWLATKRMADVCRNRGVHVVSYQHGGAYGTHDWTPQDLTDWADADYFLSYGPGIEPPPDPIVPRKAVFVPVGSARLALWKEPPQDPPRRPPRVLWVAELASRNLFGYWLIEDTTRYVLERRCLELLGAGGVDVTYRPYSVDDSSGVVRWLQRAGPPSVRISTRRDSLLSLVQGADIVISDTSSGTVWNEVLALGKPLILYCEPATTRLTPAFAADLAEACRWCRSEDELVHAVQELVAFREWQPPAGVDRFLGRYVLGDGEPVARVVSFLESLCGDGTQPPTLNR